MVIVSPRLDDLAYDSLWGGDELITHFFESPLINVGMGDDVSINNLAEMVAGLVGYAGKVNFITSKPDDAPRMLLDFSVN